jgi:hypothetical protein
MLYLLIILLTALIAVTLLRLRVRFELSDGHRVLFVGLGRCGPELDFARKQGIIKLAGIRIKRFDLARERKEEPVRVKVKKPRPARRPRVKKAVRRSPGDIVRVLRRCVRPAWAYLISLLKAAIVEKLEGRIEGGFDEPHVTGAVFGYYRAALAAVPGVVGRVQYVPVWIGPSFSGQARVAVAIPLYKFLARTAVLIVRLPLRDLVKLAIGKKKGDSDVQQRR